MAIILYGPPAAGKDTITDELLRLDDRLSRYLLLKVPHTTQRRRGHYRFVDTDTLNQLEQQQRIIWRAERYGATYAVDDSINDPAQQFAVIHAGHPELVEAIRVANATQLVVYLHCPRPVAKQRLISRNGIGAIERLAVWDQTPPIRADITIDTSTTNVPTAAALIAHKINQG